MILKRIGLLLAVVGIAAFGADSIASAEYVENPATVIISNPTPPPGGTFTVTVNNCEPGENVIITLPPAAPVTVVCGSDGTAVASLTAPLAAGTYPGTVVLQSSGTTLSFQVTVAAPSGGLPATGSDGTSGTLGYALGVLVLGAGLFAVAQVRRRRTALA